MARVRRRFDGDAENIPPGLLDLIQACADHITTRSTKVTQFDTSKPGFAWVRPSDVALLCKGRFGDPDCHEPQAIHLARTAIARTQEVMGYKVLGFTAFKDSA